MLAYLKLMRPLNGIMAALAAYIGALLVGAPLKPDFNLALGMVSVFLVSGGGMAINDFFDIEIDKLNRPNRPLPSGKISKRSAAVFAGLLFIFGLAGAYYLGFNPFVTAIVASGLLIAYAAYLKKTILIGNLIVSGMVGLTFVYGSIIIGDYVPVLPFAMLALLSNMGRELYKTIDDAMGDRKYNVNSLAIKLGVLRTRLIANMFIVAAVIFSVLPYVLGTMGIVYLFFVLLADIIFLVSTIIPIRFASKLVKIAMLLALLSFLAGIYAVRFM